MAGFSQETADFIKNAVRDWLLSGASTPAVSDPGPDTFGKMLSFFLGEEVPNEYVPMIRKDFGYSPEATARTINTTTAPRPRIAIIGAGASGLCLAYQLNNAGLDWHLYEKNEDVGGTWHENRYPGCGVDTPNHFYCYSFAPNPDWTHFFSGS
ncbi:MAG: FAD-dependent oxidoreductase, partial [Actinobacteria bacterium]|nr:FAD-dependent oxidoreductase [Actinomycetota bacterium]